MSCLDVSDKFLLSLSEVKKNFARISLVQNDYVPRVTYGAKVGWRGMSG